MLSSLQMSSQTLFFSQETVAAPTDDALLGAILLFLLLEYLKSNDEQEKESLLHALGILVQMQQAGQGQSLTLMYSSSSISMDSLSIQMGSAGAASHAYAQAAAVPGQDAGTAGGMLNMLA